MDRKIFSYNVFSRTCPSHTVLEVLANKWTYLVVCSLRGGPQRFGELTRKLEGVTPKMLTQTLRLLERDGLVSRAIFPVIPPRVDYELTPLGRDLVHLLDQILQWSEQHVPEILKARAKAGANAPEFAPEPA
ncbi:helix-turn-helix domain-containing protein [Terrarubrum flagellatum]|uniref:winged helix-turn-helix transcriptional regulator n=1 Tax=Terrirubrum flagellatum TaxID=2895980 RepID=UPI003144F22F